MGYLSISINFENSTTDVQYSAKMFNIPKERNLMLLVLKENDLFFQKSHIFPINIFSFNEAGNISPLHSACIAETQNLSASFWLNVSVSGNILPEIPSEAQQSAAADVCATPAQSLPKLPKSQQEEKRRRLLKYEMLNIWSVLQVLTLLMS